MNFKDILEKTKRFFIKHGPRMMVWGGVAGMATAGVMACVETRKAEPIFEDHKKRVADSDNKFKETMVTAGKLGKVYWPSITVGLASGTSVIFGHEITEHKNLFLASACASAIGACNELKSDFDYYRANVIQKYGEDADVEMRTGLKEETIEEVVTDDKGKNKKVKKTVVVVDEKGKDNYIRIFAPGYSTEAAETWEDQEFQINMYRGTFNRRLRGNRHLYFNDALTDMGYPKTAGGQTVGWIYDENNPIGDNCVSIETHRITCPNGAEGLLLEFNVDGAITNRLIELGEIEEA